MLTTLILSSILVVAYTVTLGRVIKGTRFPFIIFLISFLIGSNIGSITASSANWALSHKLGFQALSGAEPLPPEDVPEWNRLTRLAATACFVRDGCFCVAMWTFCFRYWNISNVIPSAMKG